MDPMGMILRVSSLVTGHFKIFTAGDPKRLNFLKSSVSASWQQGSGRCLEMAGSLVNIQKTMGNHHF